MPELISLIHSPSMPAPMQSSDPGEAWVWGDFFATLQKDPPLILKALAAISGHSADVPAPMAYPFALMVFYHRAKNPYGPSACPVLCIGLEQANYDAIGLSGVLLGNPTGKGPVMVGMFHARGHNNYGEFRGAITADSARACFFERLREELNLTGEPTRIGTIKDVFGHPDTGWPAAESE